MPEPPGSPWQNIPAPDPILDEQGACRGFPQAWWFDREDMVEVAKDVCAACPVKAKCLDYALRLAPGLDYGIWGGTTKNDRMRLRRQRRKT